MKETIDDEGLALETPAIVSFTEEGSSNDGIWPQNEIMPISDTCDILFSLTTFTVPTTFPSTPPVLNLKFPVVTLTTPFRCISIQLSGVLPSCSNARMAERLTMTSSAPRYSTMRCTTPCRQNSLAFRPHRLQLETNGSINVCSTDQ